MSDLTALILCIVLVVFFGVPLPFAPFVLGALVIGWAIITGEIFR